VGYGAREIGVIGRSLEFVATKNPPPLVPRMWLVKRNLNSEKAGRFLI
jgi:hypothetical protein